ncbi:retron St85 family RNA-directed DNA polymerase [Mesorhizobium sp. B1-1-5]|uniref:retron St85 family RNA-directed DNA polymerase n=1 Tax=Mesorhizobium sp. B1-1-5 TaxID=2589979 RepID=UPI001129123A|nr:retron St85 family RNA-directed DNA polymerase [Mesorhizobium sp. B1-1-5]TPO12075.1 RNA-directed DNA polymerase [Mesorhizobium sp. B1-1-5]
MSIVDTLSIESGLEVSLVERIIRNAPVRYKTYQIPKRSGGTRTISQPAREVKVLQRSLSEVLLRLLPVHEAAMAYRPGMSIRDNALRHAGDGPILKMDFKDFFPSIKTHDWVQYCKETGALTDPGDVRVTTLLLFQRPKGSTTLRLAIGAPSSPFVSNALLYEFDERITAAVARDHVIYTRYADDLTFSAPRTGYLVNVEKMVQTTLAGLEYPKLLINAQKTTRITRKYGRRVTGLTLTNDGGVSIGHERKRILHAQVHNATKDLLDKDQIAELKGMLGFVNSVEPQFLDVLRRRYGHSIITSIQRFELPPPTLDLLE